jgi:hypothetical protein
MNYLKSLPTKNAQSVRVLAMHERAKEGRSISNADSPRDGTVEGAVTDVSSP